jgi:hypothetical protein
VIHSDQGEVIFHYALRDKIPEEHREFGDVWRVYAVQDGVLFSVGYGTTQLMWWSDSRFRVRVEQVKPWAYMVSDELYSVNQEKGLQKLVDLSPVPVPGGESRGSKI